MEYDNHQKEYAKFILENDETSDWFKFSGKCLMIGIRNDIDINDILRYVFENYHSLTLEEIPTKIKDIEEDILIYFKHFL